MAAKFKPGDLIILKKRVKYHLHDYDDHTYIDKKLREKIKAKIRQKTDIKWVEDPYGHFNLQKGTVGIAGGYKHVFMLKNRHVPTAACDKFRNPTDSEIFFATYKKVNKPNSKAFIAIIDGKVIAFRSDRVFELAEDALERFGRVEVQITTRFALSDADNEDIERLIKRKTKGYKSSTVKIKKLDKQGNVISESEMGR